MGRLLKVMNKGSINSALRGLGLKTVVSDVISREGYGLYETVRFRTARGGHLIIKFYINDFVGVSIKSVCRVRDKYKTAFMLINGQASTNCIQVALFYDGFGPKIDFLSAEEISLGRRLREEGASFTRLSDVLGVGFSALSYYLRPVSIRPDSCLIGNEFSHKLC